MTGSRVAGLVLAAGEGRRLGRPKALVEVGGQRLVDRAVGVLRGGDCDPVVVVSGAVDLSVPGAVVVPNPDWPEGMGSSLRAGLVALDRLDDAAGPARITAVVIALVDMPGIGPEAVRRLVTAHREGAAVAVATYGGQVGHPVIFGRGHWAEVRESAVGDRGARAFFATHADLVTAVPCDGTGSPDDLDTPEDLTRLTAGGRGGHGPGG